MNMAGASGGNQLSNDQIDDQRIQVESENGIDPEVVDVLSEDEFGLEIEWKNDFGEDELWTDPEVANDVNEEELGVNTEAEDETNGNEPIYKGASLTLNQNKFNFRYQYLLIEVGTKVVREIFDVKVGYNLGTYLATNKTHSDTLQILIAGKKGTKKPIINDEQAKLLPPIDNHPISANFDISLLTCLLRNICGLLPATDNVWVKPASTDVSIEADIGRLRQYRNKLMHGNTVRWSETKFDRKWKKLVQVLKGLNKYCGLGNLSSLIDGALHDEIDEAVKERYDKIVREWSKIDDVLDKLREDVALLQHGQNIHAEEIRVTKNKVENDAARIGVVESQQNIHSEEIRVTKNKVENDVARIGVVESKLNVTENKVETVAEMLMEMKAHMGVFESQQNELIEEIHGKKDIMESAAQTQQDSTCQRFDDITDMRRATSADLMKIADVAIRQNWEQMAPFLHVADETVERIQKDNPGKTTMQIYEMLKVWSQQSGSRATLQNLQRILEEVPNKVHINWSAFPEIMRQSSSEESPQVPAPTCSSNPNEVKGRLKTLTEKEIKEFQNFCLEKIGEGGFGEVFKGKDDKIPGLHIPVVLKKIHLISEHDEHKMRSITNEKLASRTMHFAIVPLLAFGSLVSERLFYFVTPYLEKGTLANAIEKGNKLSSPLLTVQLGMKILYHIASAIHFLHTPVDKFRRTILHMDITTSNIVLDQWYNARLIDFGLAREMNEGSDYIRTTKLRIPHTPGYFEITKFDKLDRFVDYYNFGVVTLELMTGMKPYDEKEDPHNLAKSTVEKLKRSIMELWKNSEKKPFEVATDLVHLSKNYLLKDPTERDEELDFKMILDTIKDHMVDKLQNLWDTDREWKKCDMCMQYDAVGDTILEHNKECSMKVCVSCMRHSYCNPIICHSCGEEITPNIGHGWDAVLIAGNDVTNTGLAKGFSKDVEEIKKVITSKCPLVMGISEKNVLTIKPKSPGNSEDMKKSLTDQLNEFLHLEEKQKTLLLFFSGHYVNGNGFMLGKEDEYITIRELQNLLLGSDKSAERSLRLIIFLDCCCAPGVLDVNFIDKQAEIIIVQMNACRDKDKSYGDSEGSVFQRLFTQALTGNALSSKCTRITRSSKECNNCCINNDFVTLYNLHEYMDTHFELCDQAELSKPTVHLHRATMKDIRIGYVVNFQVDLKFIFDLKDEPTEPTNIPHSMFSNIEDLRTVLFDEYLKKKLKYSGVKGPGLSTTYFLDILFIYTKDGPKDSQHFELDTIENVTVAWDARRDLYVSLRKLPKVGTGLIGCFFETSVEPVVNYLFSQGTKTNGDENTMEVTTNYEEFFDYLVQHSSSKEVTNVIYKLHEFKNTFENEHKVTCTNLSVNFPYDEKASPRFRNDFLSFRLQVDKTD